MMNNVVGYDLGLMKNYKGWEFVNIIFRPKIFGNSK